MVGIVATLIAIGTFIVENIAIIAFIASLVTQQKAASKARKRQREAEAAADAAKGTKLVTEGEQVSLRIIYGRQLVGGAQVFFSTTNSYTNSAPGAGGQVFSASGALDTSINGEKHEFLFVQQAICYGGINGCYAVDIDNKKIDGEYVDDVNEVIKIPGNFAFFDFVSDSVIDTQTTINTLNTVSGTVISASIPAGATFVNPYTHGAKVHVYPSGNIADPLMTANASNRADAVFSNIAYATGAFRLNRDDPQFGGVPSMQFYVEGLKVKTILGQPGARYLSTDKVYSNNPALCLLDYLTNTVYGRGLAEDQLDLDSFYKAFVTCDITIGAVPLEGILWMAKGGTRSIKLYETNIGLDSSKPIRENIEQLLETLPNSDLIWSAGKYRLQFDYPVVWQTGYVYQPDVVVQYTDSNGVAHLYRSVISNNTSEPTTNADWESAIDITITDDDIIRESATDVTWPNSQSRFNFGTLRFINEAKNFAEDSVSWPEKYGSDTVVYNKFLEEDSNEPLETDMFGEGITDYYHAKAYIEQLVRESRSKTNYSLTVSRDFIHIEPGDIIKLVSEVLNIPGELLKVAEVKPTGEGTIELSLIKFDANVLAWNIGDNEYVPPRNIYSQSIPNVNIDTIQFVPNTDPNMATAGTLTWARPNSSRITEFVIQYTTQYNNAATNWQYLGRSFTNKFVLPIMPTGAFVITIISVDSFGRKAPESGWPLFGIGVSDVASESIALTVYQRNSVTPIEPVGGSYNFTTSYFSPPNGWYTTPPSGTSPLYSISAVAYNNPGNHIDTDLVWGQLLQLSNGTLFTKILEVYARGEIAEFPQGGSYTFPNGPLVVPTSTDAVWSPEIPPGFAAVYRSTALAESATNAGLDNSLVWTRPLKISAAAAQLTATVKLYKWAPSKPTPPSITSEYDWNLRSQSNFLPDNAQWTTSLPVNPGMSGMRAWSVSITLIDYIYSTKTLIDWSIGIVQEETAIAREQEVSVYQWAASLPAAPVQTSEYNWDTNTFTFTDGQNGWFKVKPEAVVGNILFKASTTVRDNSTADLTSFNWTATSISKDAYASADGLSYVAAYCKSTDGTAEVITAQTTGVGSVPPNGAGLAFSVWSKTVPTIVAGEYLYVSDGIYNPATDQVSWGMPYWASLKVGALSALSINTGQLVVDATGFIKSSNFSTGVSGWQLDTDGFEFNGIPYNSIVNGPPANATVNRFMGAWDPAVNYIDNDVVTKSGSSWVCLDPNISQSPPELPIMSNAYWHVYAQKGQDGLQGINGTRTAILDVYYASEFIPAEFPTGTSTFDWYTQQFTAPTTPNNWSITPPTIIAPNKLWVLRQLYSDQQTGQYSTVTWSNTVPSEANGADGADGAPGLNGYRTAFLELYKWAPTQPNSLFPNGTSTYTWETGAFTLPLTPNDWSLVPGAAVPGQTLWACSVRKADQGVTLTSDVEWSTGVAYPVGVAGANGANAKLAVLLASSNIFKVSTDGLTASPSIITLTAHGQNVSVGEAIFDIVDGSATLTPVDAVTKTIAFSSLATDSIKVRLTWDGIVDYVTIAKVRDAVGSDGLSAITIVFANEAHVLPADSSGAVQNYANSGSIIEVYEGTTKLTAGGISNGSFTVALSSQSPTAISTPGNITYDAINKFANIAAHAGMSQGLDTVAMNYTITVKRSNGAVTAYNKIQTLTKSKTGADGLQALTVNLSNEAHLLASSSDGTVSSYVGSGTTITVYEGTTALTANQAGGNGTFKVNTITQLPLTTITVASPLYNGVELKIPDHNAMQLGQNSVVISYPLTITRSDGSIVNLTKTQTIAKSKKGDDATIYSLDLNSPVVYKASPDFATDGIHTSISASGYKIVGGVKTLTGYVSITANGDTEAAGSLNSAVLNIPNNADKTSFTVRLRNQAAVAGSTLLDEQVVPIVFSGTNGTTPTVFWLMSSATIVGKSALGVYNPGTVTFTGMAQTGSNTPAVYAGRWRIFINDVLQSESVVNESAKAVTVPANTTSIKAQLFYAGGTSILLDEQTIAVVTEGAQGDDAVVGVLSNDTHAVPSDNLGNNPIFTGCATTMSVYEGAIDVSAAYTFTVVKSTGLTSVASGTPLNRTQTVTGLTTDTGYIDITATNGATSITKRFSVAKTKAGIIGTSAIVAILTNESHSIPTDKDGNIGIFTGSGTDIAVYEGTTKLPFTGTYSGTLPTAGTWKATIAGTDIVPGNLSDIGDNAQIAAHISMSALTARVIVTIYACSLSGQQTTFTRVQSLSKARAGDNGSTVSISSNRGLAFTATNGVLDATTDLVLTANTNLTGAPTFVWDHGAFTTLPTIVGNTMTISRANFLNSSSVRVSCTVNGVTDTVTIVRLEKNTAAGDANNTAGALAGTVGISSGGIALGGSAALYSTGKTWSNTVTGFYLGYTGVLNQYGLDIVGSGMFKVRSATSGARMEISDSVIKVFDANNVLRVQLGDLSA